MLAVKHYTTEYIDECYARMTQQLEAYRALPSGKSVEAFEPLFFNNLILALDYGFVHRTRGIEGKDGNPLNEVRMLCASILSNGGVLSADKTIKYRAETSVLKLEVGDEILIDEASFVELLDAFFDEIRRRFT